MESEDEQLKTSPQEEIEEEPKQDKAQRTVSSVGDLSRSARIPRNSSKEEIKKRSNPFRFK